MLLEFDLGKILYQITDFWPYESSRKFPPGDWNLVSHVTFILSKRILELSSFLPLTDFLCHKLT